MKKFLCLTYLSLMAYGLAAQSFEVSGIQENYRGVIGETIKAPIRFKNTTDKTITLIIRRIIIQIGGTQKNYFCLDDNCIDHRIEDYSIKIEPDQNFNDLQIALEAGLASGHSLVKYVVFNKNNASESVEIDLNYIVEEKAEKENIYSSRLMILYDVYPNPVTDYAFVDYKLLNEQLEAKIVIHNILGNPLDEYPLPAAENKVRIRADVLNAGIYFYTLYLDNEGVVTRKLIVKK